MLASLQLRERLAKVLADRAQLGIEWNLSDATALAIASDALAFAHSELKNGYVNHAARLLVISIRYSLGDEHEVTRASLKLFNANFEHVVRPDAQSEYTED